MGLNLPEEPVPWEAGLHGHRHSHTSHSGITGASFVSYDEALRTQSI